MRAAAKNGEIKAMAMEFQPVRSADHMPDFLAVDGEMAAQMRSFDWTASGLGPPETWPLSLKTVVRIMLTSRYAMWMAWGPNLTFFCNDAYLPTVGIKRDWVLGARSDKVWEEIWPDIGPRIDSVLQTGRATWDEGLLLFLERRGFSEETYHTFSYSPLADDGGRINGMLCVVTEVTERVVGERRLTTLRELGAGLAASRTEQAVVEAVATTLQAASRDVPFGLLYIADAQGRWRLARAMGFAGIHTAAPATLTPTGPWPLPTSGAMVVNDLGTRFAEPLPTGAWPRTPDKAAVLPIAAQGQERAVGWLIAGLNPHRPYDASYEGFLNLLSGQIAAGLASARSYEEERERAKALAELDRAKTQFFSNVSHEFRTPLTLMMGPLEEALHAEPLPPATRGLLSLAHRNALRLLKLVNALLDFTRIEAGRTQATFEPLDLAALTADLASNFRSATARAGLSLTVDCPPLPQPVYVDREMWEKILLNLLSNAFKFTFEGGIAVHLAPSADGRCAVLQVRDSGVGVPAEELPRLFERFHRIEGQRGRSFEGSGIGLALVQELVRLHGGVIRVASAPGQGTTFTIEIPFGTAHLSAERLVAAGHGAPTEGRTAAHVEEAMHWLPDTGGSAESNPLAADADPTISVLIADDNADLRDYVARLLRPYWTVQTVSDGEQALVAVRAAKPDILVTNVMMPNLDGFGLLRAIRADPKLRNLPVVLLSARAGEEARVEGLDAGADDYLTKPFAARELVARVRANLELARVRSEVADALRESEARFRNMADNAPVMVWTTDVDGACLYLNRRRFEFTGMSEVEALGFGWLDAVHLEDRRHAEEVFLDANNRRATFQIEYRLRRHDGTYRWAIDAAAPRISDDGAFLGYVGSVIDITDRRQAEDQRTLLVNELNHRVKNTLATVQSMAAQTLRGAAIDVGVREALESRLFSLARAHDLLTQQNWTGAHLVDVVRKSLEPFHVGEARIQASGPDLRVSPKFALAVSMALHELATNAVKYGALANATGTVRVVWSMDGPADARTLHLTWTESGGPMVHAPTRRGFGSRLIERGLAGELGGKASVEYHAAGVVCAIDAPLPGPASALPNFAA